MATTIEEMLGTVEEAMCQVRILAPQPPSVVSVGCFRFLEKYSTLPPLTRVHISLGDRKTTLAWRHSSSSRHQSPVANFPYPKIFA